MQKRIKNYFSLFFTQSNNAFGADEHQFFISLGISMVQETEMQKQSSIETQGHK